MITIDPGYAKRGQGCACALFAGGVLRNTWFARPEHGVRLTLRTRGAVVVEKPQYDTRTKGAASAVLELAWQGALLAGLYAGALQVQVIEVTPAQWKGSIPKPVQHSHLWAVLHANERAMLGGDDTAAKIERAVERGSSERWKRSGDDYYSRTWITHNLLDAVAIGCVQLGRLSK